MFALSPSARLVTSALLEHRWRVVLIVSASFVAGLFEAATFGFIALTIDLLAQGSEAALAHRLPLFDLPLASLFRGSSTGLVFISFVVATVLCQLVRSGLVIVAAVASTDLAVKVQHTTQNRVFDRVLSFSFGCASSYKAGELANLVQAPSLYVSTIVDYAGRAVVVIAMMIFYVAMLAWMSLPLFLFAVLVFGTIWLVQRRQSARIRKLSAGIAAANNQLSQEVVESIGALRAIHSLGLWETQRARLRAVQERLARETHRMIARISMIAPVSDTMFVMAVGLFLCAGYFFFQSGQTSFLAELVTFIAVLNRLGGRMTNLAFFSTQVSQKLGMLSILDDLLSDESKTFLRSGGVDSPKLERGIDFEDVWLTYPARTEPALAEINFHLAPGSMVALVGSSGAGKSSLADLLTGLHAPSRGRILVDGIDLTAIAPLSWTHQLAVVSQDVLLFNESLKENIRRGRPGASDEDVIGASKLAYVDDFVRELPEGYDTVVGERGFVLSGGQRQRVALARALVREARVVILDEATSALDSQSERALQQTLDSLRRRWSSLVIAHRLSTVMNADLILVVEEGRIVERGTHEELLTRRGRYAALWQAQNGRNVVEATHA